MLRILIKIHQLNHQIQTAIVNGDYSKIRNLSLEIDKLTNIKYLTMKGIWK